MKISRIQINHMYEPVGFELNDLRIEFEAEVTSNMSKVKKCIVIKKEGQTVYESGWESYYDNVFSVSMELMPRTRYDVSVFLKAENQGAQGQTFFETGKMNETVIGEWIGNSNKELQNTLLKKDFSLHGTIKNARLYISGLGLYEAYLNSTKIGDEFLSPGVTAYDKLVQLQTYDLTAMLADQKNELLISLGDGWYKGNYGFDGGQNQIYGDQQMALAELHLQYVDGTVEVVATDASWETTKGKITKSAIYYGEDLDDTIEVTDWEPVVIFDHTRSILQDRLSLPVKVKEYLPVKEIITTPAGETVLDFGQNQAGWPEFKNLEQYGIKLRFEMGEILQNGNFYRENLREARAAFTYVSDGQEKWIRPHFTYYGYRYIKVTGNTRLLAKSDFRAAVLYSDMEVTGEIQTGNQKVDRLLQNILWSQKSNFIDVPTDCPQRDERLGWSGDANVFSNTAALNMNAYAFFKKYAKDMTLEQSQHDGMLTMYAPAMGNGDGGAAAWGDAATIIPWNMYQASKDPAILQQNYSSMKAWVNWISRHTPKEDLWVSMFQFGDWLAMDGENPALPTGKTDEDFIASVYYYYSSRVVSQTAAVLKNKQDEKYFAAQAQRVKKAIQDEYLTPNGRLALDTQTAYTLSLYFDLVPLKQKKRVLADLVARLDKDDNHLKTGFVGTPLLCQVLSDNGEHHLATQIFLNEDFPSWLYAVNLGATTVWERWNSVLPDGSMNPEGMNSLNHYSIGAVMEWVYKYVWGLSRQEAGNQKVEIAPIFDYRFKHIKGHYISSYGKLSFEYELEKDEQHTICAKLNVPFGQKVTVKLPRSTGQKVLLNGKGVIKEELVLTNGSYILEYQPTTGYIEYYDIDMSMKVIMADQELVKELSNISSNISNVFAFFKNPKNLENLGGMSLPKLTTLLPFINITPIEMEQIQKFMQETPLMSERKFLNDRCTF